MLQNAALCDNGLILVLMNSRNWAFENIVRNGELLVTKIFSFSLCGFYSFNPLLHMPILGFYNSAANKNMMSKIPKSRVQLSD